MLRFYHLLSNFAVNIDIIFRKTNNIYLFFMNLQVYVTYLYIATKN